MLEEALLTSLDSVEKYRRELKKFNESRKSVSEHATIAGRLEDNQVNLLKIIENGDSMQRLFQIVKEEMDKVGDVSRAIDGFREVDKLVGLPAGRVAQGDGRDGVPGHGRPGAVHRAVAAGKGHPPAGGGGQRGGGSHRELDAGQDGGPAAAGLRGDPGGVGGAGGGGAAADERAVRGPTDEVTGWTESRWL